MKDKVLITSALLYANGPLHFGHLAGAYLPADCYARFERLLGKDVHFISGSDEYGVAVTLSAELAGRTPQEQVDLYHTLNTGLFKKLDITFDHYSRTTWEGHEKPVHRFFLELLENGYIEDKVTDQLYSEQDDRFLADRYVVGTCPKCGDKKARGDECLACGASYEATDLIDPCSKMTGAPLTRKATRHWFLLLDKFQEKLSEWIKTKNWKKSVLNFVKNYIDDLHPRAITRDSKWGISIPLIGTEGKVLYVWFDAPIGYISASMEWASLKESADAWKDYWCDPKTKLVHFIGKDNIPFHAVIFPAMLMGQNQPYKLVDEIPANEFYKLEGRQFSKSEGWFIDLDQFLETYSSDQIRYVIAANAPESSDSEFTWADFQARCNGELLGKYGNFANRVLVFCHKQCGGTVPPMEGLQRIDREFLATIQRLIAEAASYYRNFQLRKAAQALMELAQAGNVYFNEKKPWQEAKVEAGRESMRNTLVCCLECLKALALISFPIIPVAASKLWNMLGYQEPLQEKGWYAIESEHIPLGQKLLEPEILFQKIENSQIEKEQSSLWGQTGH